MRVAFVSPFTTQHGNRPARERTRRIAAHLSDRGHDVIILCAQWWDGDHDTFDHEGLTYRRVSTAPTPAAFAARLPNAIRRVAPEVVQVCNSPPSAAISAALTGTLRRTPVVVDWWCDRECDTALAYRQVTRTASAITTPAQLTRTAIREHGAAEDAVHVVPESIDFDLVVDQPVDDRFDIVTSRRLDRHANVETLLLGLAELRGRDWNAAILGDGPERDAIESTAAELRIDDRVTFLGELPIEKRLRLFKGAHVFAQTATREVFATELLWALACGCIGLVEYQSGSSAHELVEGRDRASLVTSPQELADEFRQAGSLDHRTVDDSFDRFDHAPIRAQYLDLYRDVLDR